MGRPQKWVAIAPRPQRGKEQPAPLPPQQTIVCVKLTGA